MDNRGIFANMDETAKYKLSRSVHLMGSLFQDFSKNTITIELLELIIAKKGTFLAVAKVFEEHLEERLPLTTHALEKTLSCREKDLKTLEEVLATVRTLLYFLKEIRDRKLFLQFMIFFIRKCFFTAKGRFFLILNIPVDLRHTL